MPRYLHTSVLARARIQAKREKLVLALLVKWLALQTAGRLWQGWKRTGRKSGTGSAGGGVDLGRNRSREREKLVLALLAAVSA